ncbi:MAG: N-acetyltransferase [Anaerolineae bacterium]|nr:N-acetyltransferase [Anaerolineae bacterium]
MSHPIAATSDVGQFENATIGEDALIEPGVTVGFRYHQDCGRARIGRHAILRLGTVIYGDVEIGDHFQSGHYAVVRALVRMGDYCTLLNHSCIEGITRLGDGVRIMTNTYIPTRTWIGDNVFIGPGVTFLNDRYPGRRDPMPTPRGATLEDDVMVGGGCTILPGVRIGRRSFIAAGTVVTKDIPPNSFVSGVPGRIEPLPDHLNCDNNRRLTLQPLDLWHPRAPHPGPGVWPADWPEPW